MKLRNLSLAVLLSAFSVSASGTWTIRDKEYKVDTVYHAVIGPGTTHTRLVLSGGSNLTLFYTTTDMTDDYVDMRVGKVGYKPELAPLSKMCETLSHEGAEYIAGVNADFFNFSGARKGMIGVAVIDGKVVHFPAANHETSIGIDPSKKVIFAQCDLNGRLTNKRNGQTRAFSIVNSTVPDNKTIVFSPEFGENTATPAGTYEIAMVPATDEQPMVGKTVKMKIVGNYSTAGSMTIPRNGWVISASGNVTKFISDALDGDEIDFKMTLTGNSSYVVEQMCSGCPLILQNGTVTNSDGLLDHLPTLQPRTSVGYNTSTRQMVLMVVDGRSSASAGCTSKALADIMKNVGCNYALNFDGGGSSELYLQDFGIMNVPSDGNERSVSDGLWVVSTAPADAEIASIRFVDYAMELDRNSRYTPQFYGYNRYGALVSKNVEGVVISCPEQLGTITSDGTTLEATGTGCHALTGSYNGMTCTIPVHIAGTVGGVEAVTSDSDDSAPAVYYNLQGVRVDNPESGLFIEQKGQHTSKVVIN